MREAGRLGAGSLSMQRFTEVVVVLAVLAGLVAVAVVVAPSVRQPRVTESPRGATLAPEDVPDPVKDGEPTPPGYREVFARDGIAPIYDPVHVDAGHVDWSDDTLVIGVAVGDEAVAYPVFTLNRREIVNDRVGDTPILASW
jgi:hypothetical protein